MRTGSTKGNNARKVLSFYRVNFGYEPPYRVLLDPDMVQTSITNNLFIKNTLPNLLNATAYVVVTACVVRTLREAGETHSSASLFAKRATRIPCTHEGKKSAADCIKSRMITPFEFKLLLASNDTALIAALATTPGIPLISLINDTKLVLRPPTKFTMQYVRDSQSVEERTLTKSDKTLIERVRAEKKAAVNPNRIIRKHKRAKAPNPLSVKKPLKKVANPVVDAPLGANSDPIKQGATSALLAASNVHHDTETKQRSRELQNAEDLCGTDSKQITPTKPGRKRKRVRTRQRSKTDREDCGTGEYHDVLTKDKEPGSAQEDLSPSCKRQKTSEKQQGVVTQTAKTKRTLSDRGAENTPLDSKLSNSRQKRRSEAQNVKNLNASQANLEPKKSVLLLKTPQDGNVVESTPVTSKGSGVNTTGKRTDVIQNENIAHNNYPAVTKKILGQESNPELRTNSESPSAIGDPTTVKDIYKVNVGVDCSGDPAKSCESSANGNSDMGLNGPSDCGDAKEGQAASEANQNGNSEAPRKRQRKNRRRRPKKDDSSP